MSLLIVGAALWVVNFGGLRNKVFHRASAAGIRSLVVLPLENLSGDPQQQYFADGMTEELTTELSQVGSLRVVSRTSAMRYKATRKSVPEIARQTGRNRISSRLPTNHSDCLVGFWPTLP
jgi:TolB-like protein